MAYGFDTYGGITEAPAAKERPTSWDIYDGQNPNNLTDEQKAAYEAADRKRRGIPEPAAATPEPTPFRANYQSFTPEQLAQSGIDLSAWFNQNRAAFDPNNTMGDLSQALAGRAVATGYIDENGQFVGTPYAGAGQAYQLSQLAQTGPQVTDISQSQPYQSLTSLLEQMRNTQPMTAEQRGAYGEQMMGLEAGSLRDLNQQLAGGISGVEGMSGEEKTLYQRQIQQQIDSTRKENREIMGALSGAGRSIAAYDAMETAASQIADFTIQSQLELINNDWAKKQLEYQALKDQRDMIVQSGMQGSEQYEQQLNQMWETTMTGYATQITELANQNTQYLQQFEAHAKALYTSMMSDLDLSEAAMNQSYELYAQANMPETQEQWDEILKELLS